MAVCGCVTRAQIWQRPFRCFENAHLNGHFESDKQKDKQSHQFCPKVLAIVRCVFLFRCILEGSAPSMHKYIRVRPIGRGAMGECKLVHSTEDQRLYVVKEVDLENVSEEQYAAAFNEVDVLSTLDHPNIIKYAESFCQKKSGKPSKLFSVMEYAEGGHLGDRFFLGRSLSVARSSPSASPFSSPDLPLASAGTDMIRWSRALLSHTPDATRSY